MDHCCIITPVSAASKITSAYLYYNRLYKCHVFCIHFRKKIMPSKLVKGVTTKNYTVDGYHSVIAATVCIVATGNFFYTNKKAYLCRKKNSR